MQWNCTIRITISGLKTLPTIELSRPAVPCKNYYRVIRTAVINHSTERRLISNEYWFQRIYVPWRLEMRSPAGKYAWVCGRQTQVVPLDT